MRFWTIEHARATDVLLFILAHPLGMVFHPRRATSLDRGRWKLPCAPGAKAGVGELGGDVSGERAMPIKRNRHPFFWAGAPHTMRQPGIALRPKYLISG